MRPQISLKAQFQITVNPRISSRGLIVNFEILHGGLIEGRLIRGRELIGNNIFLHGDQIEMTS